jgi:hypothetical protein
MMSKLIEPRFRAPRLWSNVELKKILTVIDKYDSVVNVSGWKDIDKEGGTYRNNYFNKASEYHITNWNSDARGMQGNIPNEIYLDLEVPVANELENKFDIVFNHTTLEHVFDVFAAFKNLCVMSKNIVIIVAPFLQEQHGGYGDYWRFTPWVIKRLFVKYGFKPAYISANDSKSDSIYIFAVGIKNDALLGRLSSLEGNILKDVENEEKCIGRKHVQDKILNRIIRKFYRFIYKD